MWFIAFVLTIPLAINLNLLHRKDRFKFVHSLVSGFNVRVLTGLLAFVVSYGIHFVFGRNSQNLFEYDEDSLFKLVACSVILVSFVTFKFEQKDLWMQRNTGCLLLILYFTIIIQNQLSLLIAQLILISLIGLWVTEIAY